MNPSELFIRRPAMTILVMFSLLFFGFAAYRSMPVSDLPNIDFPTIQVSVSYPGANPETMANSIATPLEQQFMTIEGLQSLFSSSNTGSTSIVLQFSLNRDIDNASTDVQAAITRAAPNLPQDLPNNPLYEKVNPSMTPILYLSFSSDAMPIYDLYDYANTYIGQRLSMVAGVSRVETYGSPYAVRVQIDPEKLAAKNIGLDQVTDVIQKANVNLPLGTLYGERDDFTVDVDGQIFKALGYNELVIKNEQGDLVKIKHVGQAFDSVQNDKFFHHFISKEGDEECIVLAILKQSGENTIRVIQGINATLQELKPQLPGSLKIRRIYDQSDSIIESVDEVKLTLLIALLLVILIIYFSFGQIRDTIIPSLALPIAIFGTFAIIYWLGFSINIFSMLALTLSIGFLVDDAIVVLENNIRHVQQGVGPMEAALKGAKEIGTTVLSMTLSLAASFIPMLFMSGVMGRLFREFAVTLVIAVLISGFVSLSLTPMLASRFVRIRSGEKKTRMESISERLNERIKKLYEPILRWALDHRFVMLGLGFFCIFASLILFRLIPKDFLPPEDVGFIESYTLARDGTSPYLMQEYHKKASEMILEDPNIESMISINSYNNANEGIIFIRLKPYQERLKLNTILANLSQKLKELPGLNCYLSPLPLVNLQVGTTAQALYQYSLTALDRNVLYGYAPNLIERMKQDPNFAQVSSDLRISQPQWQLRIDRDRAYNYNVSATDIENYFTYAYSDNKINTINAEINQYDIIIETLPQFYKDPTVLSKLYVRSSRGALVPLSELLDVEETVGPLTINHINGQSAVNVSFNIPEGKTLGSSLRQIETLTEGQIPAGIKGQIIGTADIFQSSFNHLTELMILAIIAIYIILGILYESFIHPLTVMSALPPALFGGLFTLFLLGQTLSVYSFVGLILLIGIVLKNGIMLIDFANEAILKEKKSAYEAIIEASLIRLRPILMTTVSALMGAVPVALGVGGALSQSRISLGCCIVGGLIISQLLTLLLTPVLYYYFEQLEEKVKKWV